MKTAAMIDIWVLVFPGFVLLDATGPVQVFSTANDEARDAGRPEPYRIHMISPGGGAVASSSGVALLTAPLPRRSLAGSTLIVSGGRGMELPTAATPDAAAVRWIARVANGTGGKSGKSGEGGAGGTAGVARCCAVCTGAFALARAGLLDHRRAVTHWQDADQLRAQFPAIDVQDDAIYVKDGAVYTSAGITAGMDLALSLVEEDQGRVAALGVAKRMVMFLKRPGGQRQFSSELLAQSEPEGLHGRLTHWLQARLTQHVDVEQMASAFVLTVRTLHRRLQQESGVTPAQLLLRLRMERACGLLERPGMTVKRAAAQSGFGTEYNLRRAFGAQLGVMPSEYRARFG